MVYLGETRDYRGIPAPQQKRPIAALLCGSEAPENSIAGEPVARRSTRSSAGEDASTFALAAPLTRNERLGERRFEVWITA
jgi:hypothetical protein